MCGGMSGVVPDKGSGESCGPGYLHGNIPTGSYACTKDEPFARILARRAIARSPVHHGRAHERVCIYLHVLSPFHGEETRWRPRTWGDMAIRAIWWPPHIIVLQQLVSSYTPQIDAECNDVVAWKNFAAASSLKIISLRKCVITTAARFTVQKPRVLAFPLSCP
ncbi:hypothetical protein ALC57_08401 [Trachymyrmex cornetzi]|uniref:Uncharacterized protein n=1 Tax=Trachymyrmex cornetzi TaxID=471704 RepID=A0A195E2W2_9HYME|nr:hypothetical protein ALC57_08401 [Trachymyrmex cornetzi]